MRTVRQVRSIGITLVSPLVVIGLLTVRASFAAETTKPFVGKTVNGGTVTHEAKGGKHILTLSKDFQVPGSPDPHWQIVDSKGTVYLLDRLKLKDDKITTTITLPAYVQDIAKVQMWCAWAEVVLGEAPFEKVVKAHAK
jgi:hypothetical protein